MLQSCTLSKGDQEIILKTYVEPQGNQVEDGKEHETVNRKTISQHSCATFPIYMYNIGQRKLVIHNTLPGGVLYIHELPVGEKFISFVKYNKLKDFGFYKGQLRIEGCSNFVYLTQIKDMIYANVIMVDPYYEVVQIAHFKSHKVFYLDLNQTKF